MSFGRCRFKCSTLNIILISKVVNVLNRFNINAHWIYCIFISRLLFLCYMWIWEIISMPLMDHTFPCPCHLVLKYQSLHFLYKLPPSLTPSSPISLLKVEQTVQSLTSSYITFVFDYWTRTLSSSLLQLHISWSHAFLSFHHCCRVLMEYSSFAVVGKEFIWINNTSLRVSVIMWWISVLNQ